MRLASLLLLAACAPEPSLTILFPTAGETVCGEPFRVSVDVQDFTLVTFEEEQPVRGEGHVDVKLNGQNRWMSWRTDLEIPLVDDGAWLLEVVLVDATHHEITPPVGDAMQVTVDGAACEEGG